MGTATHQHQDTTMDFLTTADVSLVRAETARRYRLGRHERQGPRSSLAVLLRVRAAERGRLGDGRRHVG